MKWLVTIILSNFGRFFNNPQLFHRLEDRLADSGPIKQLARTIVGVYQRGLWELQNYKQYKDEIKRIEQPEAKVKLAREFFEKKVKEFEDFQRRNK